MGLGNLISKRWGAPSSPALRIFWNEGNAPNRNGPMRVAPEIFWFPDMPGTMQGVCWYFYVPAGFSQGVVVRQGGADNYSWTAQQSLAAKVQAYAQQKFGHLAGQAIEAEQSATLRAEQQSAARAQAKVIDDAWRLEVLANSNAVADIVRAGGVAELHNFPTVVPSNAIFKALGGPGAEYYAAERKAWRERVLGEARGHIEQARRDYAQQVANAKARRLASPIKLVPAGAAGVVFGTDVNTGNDLLVRVSDIPHLLVVGTSGFGKSVFLHQLVSQLVTSSEAQQLVLVDLKGGVEFDRYAQRSSKVRVVWDYADVVAAVDYMVQLMYARQSTMKAQGLRNWNGGRVFFVVDEFAQVQLWPVTTKEEKTTHARVIADLTRLSMLGRSMGIVLVTAIQKPTADVMDSSFRGNLQGQVCFRIASRQLAASVFPALDALPADPVTLPRGRCLFYNAYTGATQLLQVHVAPEAVG